MKTRNRFNELWIRAKGGRRNIQAVLGDGGHGYGEVGAGMV